MESDEILDKVREFATLAHDGQMRKYGGDPYIVHPVRVMEICRARTADIPMLAAALLHDVLEDTPVTESDMLAFLRTVMDEASARRTLALVRDLTDVYVKKDYPRYNRKTRKAMERDRIARNHPDALTVKYADIIDNCREIVAHDRDFARVFLRECKMVLERATAGDPVLYRQAKELVEKELRSL